MVEILSITLASFYFLPFMVAAGRDHHLTVPILLTNFLTGWTGVGWVVSLAWAMLSPAEPPRPPRPTHLRLVTTEP